jgi:hypothetical protein
MKKFMKDFLKEYVPLALLLVSELLVIAMLLMTIS